MRWYAAVGEVLVPLGVALLLPLPGLAAPALAQEEASGQETRGEEASTSTMPALGSPAAFAREVRERVAVEAGAVLRRRPEARGAVLATVDAATELEVVGREGDWVEVRYGAWRGWIALEPEVAGLALPGLLERPLSAPSPERLARARELFSGAVQERSIAGYRLLSDVGDERLLDRVRGAIAHVDAAYRDWFGLDPGPPVGEVIVVYAGEEAYRTLRAAERSLGGSDAVGFAGGGLAVVHAESRVPEELSSIVVHELVHLLNRRALCCELPVWLEEGLASALAWSSLDAEGSPQPATFWRRSIVSEEEVMGANGLRTRVTATETLGPEVDLARLLRAHRAGGLPSAGELVEMPASLFFMGPAIDDHYGMSAALVRFLLDGERGRWREGFLRFLADGPRRGITGSERLAATIGTGLEEIEERLWRWVGRLVPPGFEGGSEKRPVPPR